MGRRGPPRTPTAELLNRGSHRGKSRARVEPKGDPSDGKTYPPNLRGASRQYWDRLAPQLVGMGILTKVDEEALADLCNLMEDYQYAWIRSRRPGKQQHRWQTAADRKAALIKAARRAFGLTPADRAGMDVTGFGLTGSPEATPTLDQEPKRPIGFN